MGRPSHRKPSIFSRYPFDTTTTSATITKLDKIENLKGQDVFMLVALPIRLAHRRDLRLFGKTRAGKSTVRRLFFLIRSATHPYFWFINDAYQKKVVESTGSMTSAQ